jgi:hypothetical protein
MASEKRKTAAIEPAPEGLGLSAVERWRNSCPVRSEHKSLFPANVWLWQPGAAAWVWGVLKAAGGAMPGEELTRCLAQIRGLSRRQAGGLRNQGLKVLEVFGLVEIERCPPAHEGRPTRGYGRISIIRENIDKRQARERRDQARAQRWLDVLLQTPTPPEER